MWSLFAALWLQRRMRAMEIKYYHKILHIQRPCYQWGSLCQDPVGNHTTWRPPDHHKETQTAVVWTFLPFIRPGQNHLARRSERGKTTRKTEKDMERQHQGAHRPGVHKVPQGSRKQRKMEETGCEVICGALMTPLVEVKVKVKDLGFETFDVCTLPDLSFLFSHPKTQDTRILSLLSWTTQPPPPPQKKNQKTNKQKKTTTLICA